VRLTHTLTSGRWLVRARWRAVSCWEGSTMCPLILKFACNKVWLSPNEENQKKIWNLQPQKLFQLWKVLILRSRNLSNIIKIFYSLSWFKSHELGKRIFWTTSLPGYSNCFLTLFLRALKNHLCITATTLLCSQRRLPSRLRGNHNQYSFRNSV